MIKLIVSSFNNNILCITNVLIEASLIKCILSMNILNLRQLIFFIRKKLILIIVLNSDIEVYFM